MATRVVIGGPEATIQGSPSSTCRCASRRSTTLKCQSPRSRTVVTPAASWIRSDSMTTALISSGEYSATRSNAITRLSPTRWTCVSINPGSTVASP